MKHLGYFTFQMIFNITGVHGEIFLMQYARITSHCFQKKINKQVHALKIRNFQLEQGPQWIEK